MPTLFGTRDPRVAGDRSTPKRGTSLLLLQLRRRCSSFDNEQPYRHAMANADEATEDPT